MANSDILISPVTTKAPEFIITRASINNEPVELDGRPTTAEQQKLAQPDCQSGQCSPQEQQRRSQLISERKADPAVLVDIPQTPGADELATSGADAAIER